MLNRKGLLLVVSGPSGAGKGTICKALLNKNDQIKLSVSATTRKPRNGEVHGVNYFFIEKEEFAKMGVGIHEAGELCAFCGNDRKW